VFATNLRDVLLAAPAGQRATLGLDPGYRNGVKCAVVDPTGKVLDTAIVYPHQPQNQWSQAVQTLSSLCATHGVDLLAVGNGTASRESEKLAGEVADLIAKAGGKRPTPVVMSESGDSVYPPSQIDTAQSEKLSGEVADHIARAAGNRATPAWVSECGASGSSASHIAADELPNMDVSLRGAVSLARHLQDTLAELVKIDPNAFGVGQYQ